MKLKLIVAICFVGALFFSVTVPTGCTKTHTITDTVTLKDTVTKVDTVVKIDSITKIDSIRVYDSLLKQITVGLWAYFPVYNGTVGDSSGNGHTLTLQNGVSYGLDTWGNPQGALSFGGGSQYAEIADGVNFTPDSFSVSLFFKPEASTGMLFSKINWNTGLGETFHFGVDGRTDKDSLTFIMPSNQSALCTSPGTSAIVTESPVLWNVGVWNQAVATYANNMMRFYINGVQVDSATTTESVNWCDAAPFILGNWWAEDMEPTFVGEMDEIRVYNRLLSNQEIKFIFNIYNTKR
jgi:hypothetical protein